MLYALKFKEFEHKIFKSCVKETRSAFNIAMLKNESARKKLLHVIYAGVSVCQSNRRKVWKDAEKT